MTGISSMTFVNKRHLIIAGVICLLGYPQVISGSSLASRFSCININGTPASVVGTKTGASPDHLLEESDFSVPVGRQNVVVRKCQHDSRATTPQDSRIHHHGRMNRLPVICVAKSDGGACAGLLYTLKPGQNATATLKKLFDVRTKPGAAPLEETTARMYLSMDSIIRNKSGSVNTSSPIPPTPSSTVPLPLF